jgi:hypothetical protein
MTLNGSMSVGNRNVDDIYGCLLLNEINGSEFNVLVNKCAS